MSDDEIRLVAQTLLENQMDGVIATNTTLSRRRGRACPYANEAGGLSSAPELALANHHGSIVPKPWRENPCDWRRRYYSGVRTLRKMRLGASLVQNIQALFTKA